MSTKTEEKPRLMDQLIEEHKRETNNNEVSRIGWKPKEPIIEWDFYAHDRLVRAGLYHITLLSFNWYHTPLGKQNWEEWFDNIFMFLSHLWIIPKINEHLDDKCRQRFSTALWFINV